jgi:hypothetical protein
MREIRQNFPRTRQVHARMYHPQNNVVPKLTKIWKKINNNEGGRKKKNGKKKKKERCEERRGNISNMRGKEWYNVEPFDVKARSLCEPLFENRDIGYTLLEAIPLFALKEVIG